MEEISRETFFTQILSHLFGLFPVADINNSRSRHTAEDVHQHLQFIFRLPNDISQVFPCETFGKDTLLLKEQPVLDIIHYFRRGSSRKSQHRDIGQLLPDLCNLQIRRTEIISPLGNTMTLVDHQQTNLHRLEFGQEDFGTQPFGRNIQEFIFTKDAVFKLGDNLLPAHPGMNGSRLDPDTFQVVHLVFHQGDQWSYNNTNTVHEQSRHLERNRFATTCWHQSQCIVSLIDGLNNLFLKRSEGIVSPVLLQYFLKRCHTKFFFSLFRS